MKQMSPYTLTITDLREIFAASGADHAEFCVEQMETQDGSAAAAPLKAELARLIASAAEC